MAELAPRWDTLIIEAFFAPIENMQKTIAILCECHTQPPSMDPVTHTLLTMMSCPLQIQLTYVGWNPFKGKDLSLPFHFMNDHQKETLKSILTDDLRKNDWQIHENAVTFRDSQSESTFFIDPLLVLEAVCTTILTSDVYPDRRMRVATCNIILQRVQTSIPVHKSVLKKLNERLFNTTCPHTSSPLCSNV